MSDEHKSPPNDDVITIDLQTILLPLAIIIAGGLIGIGLYFGLRDSDGKTTLAADTTPVADTDSTAGSNTGSTGSTTPSADTTQPLVDLAGELDLDTDAFAACLEDRTYEEEVQADSADGATAGITGTPGFVVGRLDGDTVTGVLISGAYPYDTFAGAIEYYTNNETGLPDLPELTTVKAASVSIDDDAILGSTDSTVGIVEFTDYECPFCQRHFEQTHPELVSKHIDTGEAFLVTRDFPLPFHDPVATTEAIAVECARAQGGDEVFYAYHDLIFERTLTNGQGVR